MNFEDHKYYVGNALDDVVFGYTKRTNGVSHYPEHSFNMALYIGDSDKNVHKHQEMLASEIGVATSEWVMPIQKHGARVCEVTEEDRETNVKSLADQLYDYDGLYTYDNILLAMNYADCVPVYVFSHVNQFTALAHAGWKGTSLNIMHNVLDEYDGHPHDLTVIIGVSINGASFQVDQRVIDAMEDEFLKDAVETLDEGYLLDLKTVNKNQALKFGIPAENIHVTPLGTEDTERFFSYRIEKGETGRALAFIGRQSCD